MLEAPLRAPGKQQAGGSSGPRQHARGHRGRDGVGGGGGPCPAAAWRDRRPRVFSFDFLSGASQSSVGLRRIYLLDRVAVLPNALRDPHTALPPRSQVQTARSATHLVTLRSCPV